jgi:hypothetical protein
MIFSGSIGLVKLGQPHLRIIHFSYPWVSVLPEVEEFLVIL